MSTATVINLLTALAIGLLIGLERGWRDRGDPDGLRVAGLRTIGLIGFLGGLLAFLDPGQGVIVAAGLLGVALLLKEGFEGQIDVTQEVSVTTMIAALTAYALGAMAGFGQTQFAAAGGVVVTFILWLRQPLHLLMRSIEARELSALLRWLLISVVVLPLLPDQQMGPFAAFNPRTFWLMVVVISGLGFAGYLGIKWLGPRKGTAFTALMGGLVSSTAVTISFAQLARSPNQPNRTLLGGTAIAWAIMVARTAAVLFVLAPSVLFLIWTVLFGMFAVASIGASLLLRRSPASEDVDLKVANPLDLKAALIFACVLAAAMFMSRAAMAWLGDTGLYAVAVIAGAVDIDAISLSVAQMATGTLGAETAGTAICIAAIANTLFKGGVAAVTGGWAYGRAAFGLSIAMAAMGAGLLFWDIL